MSKGMKFAPRIHFELTAQEVEELTFFMTDCLGVEGPIGKGKIEKYWCLYLRDAFRDGKYRVSGYRDLPEEERAAMRATLAQIMEEKSGAE